MPNSEETTLELKKYLKKLSNLIAYEAQFSWFGVKIFDKKKVDDVICCIEASWPQDYKRYLEKKGRAKIKSNQYYSQLLVSIKNKFYFSTNVYAVKYQKAQRLIQDILNTIDSDLVLIRND